MKQNELVSELSIRNYFCEAGFMAAFIRCTTKKVSHVCSVKTRIHP